MIERESTPKPDVEMSLLTRIGAAMFAVVLAVLSLLVIALWMLRAIMD